MPSPTPPTQMKRSISFSDCCHAASLVLGCLLTGLLLLSSEAMAQSPRSTEIERQVKAAYLHKFTGFVEWPQGTFGSADSPIIIGVIGEDSLADELADLVAGRTVNGRSLSVHKMQRGDSLADIHVLFLGRMERSRLIEFLSAVKGRPVLTVTEAEGSYGLGCMVNFVLTKERLRFEVALAPVEAGRLKISALMLAAAYKVVKEAP